MCIYLYNMCSLIQLLGKHRPVKPSLCRDWKVNAFSCRRIASIRHVDGAGS